MRLVALDRPAEQRGLRSGQALAEAKAMFPDLDIMPEDEAADRAMIEALADWCDRYTPLVSIDGTDGLFLDISGCAHLFGGEQSLLDDALHRLSQMGINARGAISSSPGLSWALCRFGENRMVIDDAQAGPALARLPVAALRLDQATVAALQKFGLKQVGDLISRPRAPLARRFGMDLLMRLDQARGAIGESISPRRPVASLSAERQLAEPVQSEEAIMTLAGHIASSLKPQLEARGIGGRTFELVLFRVDGRVFRIAAGASKPLQDPKRISGLFLERLVKVYDELDTGFGFELIRINVLSHEAVLADQGSFEGDGERAISLSDFIDKVSARLGTDCLMRLEFRQSHLPERAEVFVPALLSRSVRSVDARNLAYTPLADRPLRLLPYPERMEAFAAAVPDGPPQRFSWRRVNHRVTRAEGPERISPEWWLDGLDARERDYFRLESDSGHRLWTFRAGRYDGVTPPLWYVHGVFA